MKNENIDEICIPLFWVLQWWKSKSALDYKHVERVHKDFLHIVQVSTLGTFDTINKEIKKCM